LDRLPPHAETKEKKFASYMMSFKSKAAPIVDSLYTTTMTRPPEAPADVCPGKSLKSGLKSAIF
jgi:hypothetical protein